MTTTTVLVGLVVWRLAEATGDGARPRTILWGLLLTLTVTVQTLVMKRFRVRTKRDGLPWRAAWAGVQLVAGIGLLLQWNGSGQRFGRGFWGLLLTFLAVSWIVADTRESSWGAHRRGPVLLGVCITAVAIGVWAVALPGVASVVLVLLGVAAGQLAAVTSTHDIVRRGGQALATKTAVVLGALVLGVMTIYLTNVSALWGLALGLGMLALMLLTASRGEWDSIVLVGLFITFWAIAPTPRSLDSFPGPTASTEDVFVVFGDSYISGEGAWTYYENTNDRDGNQCRRAPSAWTVLLAEDSGNSLPDEMMFFACSGAVAREIWEVDQGSVGDDWMTWEAQGAGQLAQFRHESSVLDDKRVAFALVSIGGNDSGFSKVASACLAPTNCTEVARQWVDLVTATEGGTVDDPATLQGELERVYREMGDTLGESVPIIAVPYPQPVTRTGCRSTLLSENEHRFIESFVDELNGAVRRAAMAAGVHYMDTMASAVDGDRICQKGAGKAAVNFLRPVPVNGSLEDSVNPVNWMHSSMHPNEDGHRHMRDAAQRWFDANPDLSTPSYPDPERTTPAAITLVNAAPPTNCPDRLEGEHDGVGPNFGCDPGSWALRQLLISGRVGMWWVLTMFAGAWLLALVRWNERRHATNGAMVRGSSYAPSKVEDILLRVLDRGPLPWIHGGVDPRDTEVRSVSGQPSITRSARRRIQRFRRPRR